MVLIRATLAGFGLGVVIWSSMIVTAFGFAPLSSQWNRLPGAVQKRLERQGVSQQEFEPWRARIASDTERREYDGEGDHLIHYALLSRRFTSLPAIEPALSAKQFIETGAVPSAVSKRLLALEAALRRPAKQERLAELQLIAEGRDLITEYKRAMQFLYAKEFEQRANYAKRGHSTDTSVPANYAVWQGLNVLRSSVPNFAINRVLVVGPGLDFAPRTNLIETERPQSYQPFAVLDALLSLQLHPVIHCFDINPRVIRFLSTFAKHPTLELHAAESSAEYMAYFNQLGSYLGKVTQQNSLKTIAVKPELARAVTAEQKNIVTEGATEQPFDLIIATNVLLYYEGAELTLALSNISQSLAKGGFLLHNDLRPESDAASRTAGLESFASRTVKISDALFDSFSLYKRP